MVGISSRHSTRDGNEAESDPANLPIITAVYELRARAESRFIDYVSTSWDRGGRERCDSRACRGRSGRLRLAISPRHRSLDHARFKICPRVDLPLSS